METIALNLPGDKDFFTQEAYKVLRTNVQFCGADVKVIAVTSCNENEGKTTVSLHLAKSFAELGKKVLLIDADMRKSVMAGRDTTAKNTKGLSELLTGMNTLEECLYETQYNKLNILFSGQYPPNPVELVSGKNFNNLIAKAREVYDYIIIDTPPLGRVIDAAVISAIADGTVLIMVGNRVRAKQAKEVVAQLKMSNCRILGVIRNNTSKKRKSYGYGKKYYGYGKKYYGYGYGQKPADKKA